MITTSNSLTDAPNQPFNISSQKASKPLESQAKVRVKLNQKSIVVKNVLKKNTHKTDEASLKS